MSIAELQVAIADGKQLRLVVDPHVKRVGKPKIS
jgi:hypothetical protein